MHFPAGEIHALPSKDSANEITSLHRYLTDVVHVDIFWYIGSQLDIGPSTLPILNSPITGSSIVPWRYHFNTGEPNDLSVHFHA